MIIYDIDREVAEDCLLDAIRVQNTSYDKKEFVEKFKILFKTGNKRSPRVHYVVEREKSLRTVLLDRNRAFVEYESHKIRDFIRIARCFKCSGLGHTAKNCTEKEDLCVYCTEVGHVFKDCPRRANEEKPICINCKKRGNASGRSDDCPAMNAMRNLIIKRTGV